MQVAANQIEPKCLSINFCCVDYELCDFTKPPHAVYLLSGNKWLPNTPVLDALKLVADSIEDRLEQWLQES